MIDLLVTKQGAWGFGRFWPCAIGKVGITNHKKEEDGATPSGILHVTGCLYRPDRIAMPARWARQSDPAICGAMTLRIFSTITTPKPHLVQATKNSVGPIHFMTLFC